MKKYLFGTIMVSLLAFAGIAQAADLGSAAIMTLTAQTQATVTSAQYNTNGSGVICTFSQSAHTSSPSTTFSIQAYDPGTATYFTLLTSAAVTADATPNASMVYPTAIPGSVPTNMAYVALRMPPQFRVSVTVGGSGTTTAKVGCINLK